MAWKKPASPAPQSGPLVQVRGDRVLQRMGDAEGIELVHLAQLARERARARRNSRPAARWRAASCRRRTPRGCARRAPGAPAPRRAALHRTPRARRPHRRAPAMSLPGQGRGERIEVLRRSAAVQAGLCGTVEEHQPGARAERRVHPLPVVAKPRLGERQTQAASAGEPHRRLIGVVGGIERDRLIARADQRLHRRIDRLRRPERHGDFALRVDRAGHSTRAASPRCARAAPADPPSARTGCGRRRMAAATSSVSRGSIS